jgi:acetyl esterase/lipase
VKTHTYKTVGTLSLQVDVYGADPQNGTPKPVVLWIHGGALIMGNRANIAPGQRDRYLDAGFVVISIDYRLAPETKLPAIAEDVEDAFRWVREHGGEILGIDPNRVGVVGHSAGGYLTLLAGHRVDPTPQALVAFYGYGDLVGDWYSKPDPFYNTFDQVTDADAHRAVGEREVVDGSADPARRDFYLWSRQNGLWPLKVGGRDPRAESDWFAPFCPAENVSANGLKYPPTLLLHGDADTDVPYGQSVHMARQLAAAGVEHEFITIPGGPHGFDHSPEMESNSMISDAFDSVIAFLNEHV